MFMFCCVRKDIEGNTPLHIVIAEARVGELQLLLNAGADLAATNLHGITPKQLALSTGNSNIIRVINIYSESSLETS